MSEFKSKVLHENKVDGDGSEAVAVFEPLELTTRDVAAFFGITREVAGEMARSGRIDASKIAGQWRFSRSALIRLVSKKLEI